MEERQNNYTIFESFTLPSKGLIYDVEVNPTIELRSMTARDELKRSNSGGVAPFKVLADIIESCMIEKPRISVYDMAIGDYEYLLHRLRVVSYGTDYQMTIKCPECGEIVDATANLDELAVKEFDQDKFESLKTFELPVSKKQVTIKFQTPHILDMIESRAKELKRKFKNMQTDFDTLALLTILVDSVDGEKMDQFKAETFINNLPAKDMLKILSNAGELSRCIGIDNELFVDCPKCGGEVRTFFRFGPQFFRPDIN